MYAPLLDTSQRPAQDIENALRTSLSSSYAPTHRARCVRATAEARRTSAAAGMSGPPSIGPATAISRRPAIVRARCGSALQDGVPGASVPSGVAPGRGVVGRHAMSCLRVAEDRWNFLCPDRRETQDAGAPCVLEVVDVSVELCGGRRVRSIDDKAADPRTMPGRVPVACPPRERRCAPTGPPWVF